MDGAGDHQVSVTVERAAGSQPNKYAVNLDPIGADTVADATERVEGMPQLDPTKSGKAANGAAVAWT